MKLRARIRWCARSREGWCALMVNRPFPEAEPNVATVCGFWITLPGGCERREPTCPDCLAHFSEAVS